MTGLVILLMFAALAVSVAINFFLMRRKFKTSENRTCSVLLQGIRNVSELMTIRQNFQSIVVYEDSKKLLGMNLPGTLKKFILKYTGNIAVGTDLSGVEITQYVSGNVTVAIPRSRVLDINIDMNSIKVYDQRAGIFTRLDLDDQNRAIADNLSEVAADADSDELRRLADGNAKNVLESISLGMGIITQVEFKDEKKESEAEVQLEMPVEAELVPEGRGELI